MNKKEIDKHFEETNLVIKNANKRISENKKSLKNDKYLIGAILIFLIITIYLIFSI